MCFPVNAASNNWGFISNLSSFIKTMGEVAPIVSTVSCENSVWSSLSLPLTNVDSDRKLLFQWSIPARSYFSWIKHSMIFTKFRKLYATLEMVHGFMSLFVHIISDFSDTCYSLIEYEVYMHNDPFRLFPGDDWHADWAHGLQLSPGGQYPHLLLHQVPSERQPVHCGSRQ